MIRTYWDWDLLFGWHEVPCIGPGPAERVYARWLNEKVQAFINVEKFKRAQLKEVA